MLCILRSFVPALAIGVIIGGNTIAAPVLVGPGHYTHRFGPGGAGGTSTGDFVEINVAISAASTSDAPGSIGVTASQGTTTVGLPYFPFNDSILPAGLISYVALIPFNASLTGQWSISATDSAGTSAPVLSPSIAGAEFLPLVTGITLTGPSTSPTITWSLPDLTGFDVDLTQMRLIEAASNLHVFSTNLSGTPMSFVMPGGWIDPSKEYVFRIGLLDQESFGTLSVTENRSDTFSAVFQAPEPAALALLGLALAGLGYARRRELH